MATPVFGKAFTLSYTPASAGGETTSVDSLVSARIYSEYPTAAQIVDHTNSLPGDAVESVVSWSAGGETDEYDIAFAAIDDTDQSSKTRYETYYIVCSVLLESGGANHALRPEAFRVYRAEPLLSRVTVGATEAKELEEKISNHYTDAQIEEKFTRAARHARKNIISKGYDYEKIDWQDLDDVVLSLGMSYICRSISSETDDRWHTKELNYLADYDAAMKSIEIGYDVDDDDNIEPGESVTGSNTLYIR